MDPTEQHEQSRAMNVVLIGLMGSGKSTIGRLVASSLGFEFVDTDHVITEAAHRSIPQIFTSEGEAGFRKRETAALQSLLGKQNCIIATGGGIVTVPENVPLLHQLGFIVWLNAAPATLYRRTCHGNDRPLLRNPDPEGTLRDLLEKRGPLYREICDMKITTDDFSTEEIAYGLAESVRVEFAKPRWHNP